jgi:propionyl-CoA carboxylase alpha chain
MIRVAAGEKLAFTQSQIPRRGWAMECRINAEDPFRNFLPSTGRLVRYQPPVQSLHAAQAMPDAGAHADTVAGGVRVDTGVYEGGEIPMYYDSMIAKLIVHGRDRADAIARMREALNAFVIRGISSNIPFQAALLAHPRFGAGDFNTGFIAEQYPKGFSASSVTHEQPGFMQMLAAVSHRRMRGRASGISGQLAGHEVRIADDYVVMVIGPQGERQTQTLTVRGDGPSFRVLMNGREHAVVLEGALRDVAVHGSVDGVPFCAQIDRAGLSYRVSHNGAQIEARVMSPRAAALHTLMPFKAPPDMSKFLLSPMPGLLVNVAVQAGQAVSAGEKLAVIEAMKMENILVAVSDGVVASVSAMQGESLAVDQVILSFE